MNLITAIKDKIKQMSGRDYGWRGNYKNWSDATAACIGYNDPAILDKVIASALAVKRGEAAYERDSVLFNEVQYSYPLLNTLKTIAGEQDQKLAVLDFGGALGSSYFQNRILYKDLKELKWSIVEQENFVEAGKRSIEDEHLSFYRSAEEAIAAKGKHDVLLLSCVLPYIEKPYELLVHLSKLDLNYIIIENTYFNNEPNDRLTVQKVPPFIYKASYPAWFLNYEKVKSTLTQQDYMVINEYTNDSFLFLDGKKITYKGIVFKKNRPA
jgi:putative methyltransferase (TIGR04325 family)